MAFAASDYGRCLASNETFRQETKTARRVCFGTNDGIVREQVGGLGYDYPRALWAAPDFETKTSMTSIVVPGGSHHGTFITGTSEAKTWFDSLR